MIARCRLLAHEVGDGPWNMAVDEALLDSVAADPSAAVIRTYGWSVPTLSLGYFQNFRDSQPRWSGSPIIRRPTGGGALWHDLEVTYAIVVPSTHPATRPNSALYRRIHDSIIESLRRLDVDAKRRGDPIEPSALANRPFLCFTDHASDDIVFRDAKLVGSAQRRRSGAILQHGSLLLGRSSVTPELPGLLDIAPVPSERVNWISFLENSLSAALDLPIQIDDLNPEERRRAEALAQDRYSDPSWTRRR